MDPVPTYASPVAEIVGLDSFDNTGKDAIDDHKIESTGMVIYIGMATKKAFGVSMGVIRGKDCADLVSFLVREARLQFFQPPKLGLVEYLELFLVLLPELFELSV